MSKAALKESTTVLPRLYIFHVDGKGNGVFSLDRVFEGELVEECVFLSVSRAEGELIDKFVPSLSSYQFAWNESDDTAAFGFAMGNGEVYNHSNKPNVRLERDFAAKRMRFIALRDIVPHEELTIDYGISLWFDER